MSSIQDSTPILGPILKPAPKIQKRLAIKKATETLKQTDRLSTAAVGESKVDDFDGGDSVPDAFQPGVVATGKIRNVREANDYVQLTEIEQIIERCDMYIGGDHLKTEEVRIFEEPIQTVPVPPSPSLSSSPSTSQTLPHEQSGGNQSSGRCVRKLVTFIEGINRLYWEVLSNAADNIINTRHMTSGCGIEDLRRSRRPPSIRIWVTPTTVRIENGGEPIPIAPHHTSTPTNLVLPPTLILGSLRTSSNYGSDIQRVSAGRNGFGAKLTNIFSKRFSVQVKDPGNGQEYVATWRNKMMLESESTRPGFAFDHTTQKWLNLALVEGSAKRGSQKPYSGPPSVTVEYELDFDIFNEIAKKHKTPFIHCYSDDMIALFKRIAFDYSFTTKTKIEFNGVVLDARCPSTFVNAYYPGITPKQFIVWNEWRTKDDYDAAYKLKSGSTIKGGSIIKAAESGHLANLPMVELIVIDHPGPHNNFGFVNGLEVPNGVHFTSAFKAITAAIIEASPASVKSALSALSSAAGSSINISANDLKQFVSIVVNCHLPDPGFRSQTKQDLERPTPPITIPPSAFRSAMNGENRWSLTDKFLEISSFRASKLVAKTDAGRKSSTILLSKGRDSNWAGTARSNETVLFLCEGDSACSTIEQRASLVGGNDVVGVYPMKGKSLNTTKASALVQSKNVEFREIKKLVGLADGINYSDAAAAKALLRYGRIIFAADQDVDGKHIRSLLTNMFAAWPSLFKEGRIGYLATPLVRVTTRNDEVVARFFSETSFNYWVSQCPEGVVPSNLKVKYLKGLASSNMKVVREDISASPVIMLKFDPQAPESLKLAFHPKKKNDRKPWILERITLDEEESRRCQSSSYTPTMDPETEAVVRSGGSQTLQTAVASIPKRKIMTSAQAKKASLSSSSETTSQPKKEVPYGDRNITHMIDRDLGEYSKSTLARAIPYIDGMKQVTRQALAHILEKCSYSCSSEKSTKVAQVAASAAEAMHYAHGDKSMCDTIIGLAQDFIGSNNMPLLFPDGQFGTRKKNGKDAGAPRYVFTYLTRFATLLYDKDLIDLVPKRQVEGKKVEPEWLPSTLPIVLINGDRGIATGFATVIPQHHPGDCANWILGRIRGEDPAQLREPRPWFYKFKGRVLIETPSGTSTVSSTSSASAFGGSGDQDDELESSSDDEDTETATTETSETMSGKKDLIKGGERIITDGIFSIKRHPTPINSTYDLDITEIPIGVSIEKYRTYLKSLVNAKILERYMDWCNSDLGLVHFGLIGLNSTLLNDKAAIKVACAAYRAALKEGSGTSKKKSDSTSGQQPIISKTKRTKASLKESSSLTAPTSTSSTLSTLATSLQQKTFVPSIASLKLRKSISRNNMVILDDFGRPQRYENVSMILEIFTQKMLQHYEVYKSARIAKLTELIGQTVAKYNLILAIVEGRVNYKADKSIVLKQIEDLGLSVSIYSDLKVNDMTSDKVLSLAEKIRKLQEELSETQATPSWKFWESRLIEMIKYMEEYYV